mgnify:CR=1 FL=1
MQRHESEVVLGLGSNIGNRLKNINEAISMLKDKLIIVKVSKVIETEPYGYKDQPMFLNCCLIAKTALSADKLLEFVLSIEKRMGRVREFKWGPRNIDIDILFYDNLIINRDDLVIPHPELHKREFVLKSLVEIMPDFVHPKLNRSIKDIYEELVNKK